MAPAREGPGAREGGRVKVIHYDGVPCNTRPGENTVLSETSHWNRVTCKRCLRCCPSEQRTGDQIAAVGARP